MKTILGKSLNSYSTEVKNSHMDFQARHEPSETAGEINTVPNQSAKKIYMPGAGQKYCLARHGARIELQNNSAIRHKTLRIELIKVHGVRC